MTTPFNAPEAKKAFIAAGSLAKSARLAAQYATMPVTWGVAMLVPASEATALLAVFHELTTDSPGA